MTYNILILLPHHLHRKLYDKGIDITSHINWKAQSTSKQVMPINWIILFIEKIVLLFSHIDAIISLSECFFIKSNKPILLKA